MRACGLVLPRALDPLSTKNAFVRLRLLELPRKRASSLNYPCVMEMAEWLGNQGSVSKPRFQNPSGVSGGI